MGWWLLFALIAVVWLLSRAGKSSRARPAPVTPSRPSSYAVSQQAAYERSRNREPGRWVAPGETVKVAGLSIPGGMIYVGGILPSPRGYGADNCLIDPSLRVAGDNPDVLGATMSYWPAYGSITPQARLAYLQWLAGGRRDPAAAIGYVFLFFYGLERRVFVDGAREELPAIADEVRRLVDLYGANNSFRGYARRFLAMADLACKGLDRAPDLRPDLRDGYEIPTPVRVWLGKCLASGEPLGADDALLWVLSLPDTTPRTAVTRCFPEFRSLWAARFGETWPEGLRVKAPDVALKVTYRPASGTFDGQMSIEDLPDIGAVSRPLRPLRTLFEDCTEALDPYSRLLGRKPEAKGMLEAVLLLPAALHESPHAGPLPGVRRALDRLIGTEGVAEIEKERLLELLDLGGRGTSETAVLRQAGACLDVLGVGFEPDRRFGGAGAADAAQLVLFRLAGAPCDAEGQAFVAGRTMVEVAALAAAADGVIAPSEFDAINTDLAALSDLTPGERTRLLAYALALLKNPPRQQAVLNRLSKSPLSDRASIAQSALSAVLADGRVTPEEVRYLERLHKALGLPAGTVYAALHRGEVRTDEPVVVAAEAWAAGVAIPAEPSAAPPGLQLDATRLERVRKETQAVSALLADIFVEEPSPPPPPAPSPGRVAAFPGLDAAHGELLALFAAADTCAWAAFEARARSLRLLPEGALETINEWAFDRFDEPYLEGGEEVVAAAHLRPRMLELGAVA